MEHVQLPFGPRRWGSLGLLLAVAVSLTVHPAVSAPAVADEPRPVILTTDDELERAAIRVANEEMPFYDSWLKVQAAADADLMATFTPDQKVNHEQYFTLANSHAMAARDLALAFRITGDSDYAEKAMEIITDWAVDANASSVPPASGSLTASGLVVARVMVPFTDAYAMLYSEFSAADIATIHEWFEDSVAVILASKEFWRTGTQICDYGAACVNYTAPWLGGQQFSNHISAQNMGLLALGYALADGDLVDYALDDPTNPVNLEKLVDGVILMDSSDAWASDPTNTLSWPAVEQGEVYDRFRAGEYKGLGYTHINLRFLTVQADMAANNGDGTDWFAYTGADGENIVLPYDYYAQFLMSGDNSSGSGYYTGSGVDYNLLPLYEIAHREYPANTAIIEVLESFDRVAFDAEMFGWSLLLTDGDDDLAISLQPYPDRALASWTFSHVKYLRGWQGTNAAVAIAGGNLRFTLSHADPRIVSLPALGLQTADYGTLEFRMRNAATPGSGALAGNYVQLFFITDSDRVWNEAKSIRVSTTLDANNFYTYSADLSALASWAGRIYQIRFDPTQGPTSGAVDVEYLRLTP